MGCALGARRVAERARGRRGVLRARSLAGSLVLASVVGAGVAASQTSAARNTPLTDGGLASVDAARAIFALFDTYQVVGMNSAHRMKDLDDFILSLIRHPACPDAVDDVVVECGNSLYQATLDRYIAGE